MIRTRCMAQLGKFIVVSCKYCFQYFPPKHVGVMFWFTRMVWAVFRRMNDLETVKFLLDNGRDVNAPGPKELNVRTCNVCVIALI